MNATPDRVAPLRVSLHRREAQSTAAQRHMLPNSFVLRGGGLLCGAELAFETWGAPLETASDVILIFSGMSSGCHVASSNQDPSRGWWQEAVGSGRPLAPERSCVLCVSHLGSCFGSSGPLSVNPATGKSYGSHFPRITVQDQVRAVVDFLDARGIDRIAAVIGLSMGGMLALALLEEFTGRIDNFVSVSSALRSSPHARIWRQSQIDMVKSDPNWRGGSYTPSQRPLAGMMKARRLALATYTGAAGLEKLGSDLEAFITRKAHEFAHAFDANSFILLAEAQNVFDIAGTFRCAPKRALVLGSSTDILCPSYQQDEVAAYLRQAGVETSIEIVPSTNGHDAFLREQQRFAERIAAFLGR